MADLVLHPQGWDFATEIIKGLQTLKDSLSDPLQKIIYQTHCRKIMKGLIHVIL